jgi:hypothetical protein
MSKPLRHARPTARHQPHDLTLREDSDDKMRQVIKQMEK